MQNLKKEKEENDMRAKLPENKIDDCDLSSFSLTHLDFRWNFSLFLSAHGMGKMILLKLKKKTTKTFQSFEQFS